MIGIVDYNAGNLRSVEMAMEFLKIPYSISKKPVDLKNADKIVFPGVGEAAFAMEQLKKTGFDAFLKDWVAAGKNLLGICLGSHPTDREVWRATVHRVTKSQTQLK